MCYIHMAFKYLQGWGLYHFLGQPIPKLDHFFHEEILFKFQSKLPVLQLTRTHLCPVTYYLREETDNLLIVTSCQVVVDSDELQR